MSDDLVKRLRVDVFYGDERLHNLSRHNPLHMEAADRIEELERKIAKAVASLETLEDASKVFGSDTQTDRESLRYAHECTRRLCKATLAELKGEPS